MGQRANSEPGSTAAASEAKDCEPFSKSAASSRPARTPALPGAPPARRHTESPSPDLSSRPARESPDLSRTRRRQAASGYRIHLARQNSPPTTGNFRAACGGGPTAKLMRRGSAPIQCCPKEPARKIPRRPAADLAAYTPVSEVARRIPGILMGKIQTALQDHSGDHTWGSDYLVSLLTASPTVWTVFRVPWPIAWAASRKPWPMAVVTLRVL